MEKDGRWQGMMGKMTRDDKEIFLQIFNVDKNVNNIVETH
jgi:hypothetical protein